MLHAAMSSGPVRSPEGQAARRVGAVAIWLILASGVVLAALALAVNQARLWTIRAEMQAAADAAAQAAACALVDDDLLRADPSRLPGLLQRSQFEGQRYARFHIVQGQPFQLCPNPANLPDGDLIFGTLQVPRSRRLLLATDILDPTNASLALVNTVRVRAELSARRGDAPRMIFAQYVAQGSADVCAEAAAMLDRDVIGFRPIGAQVVPLAPLALLSDPSWANPLSWEYQVRAEQGKDEYSFERGRRAFVPGPDGLFEFQANLALSPDQLSQANVAILYLGGSDIKSVCWLLRTGVNAGQLAGLGGALVLGPGNRLDVPGTTQGPAFGTSDANALYRALDHVRARAEPRIWPLYCGTDGTTGQPIVCGFVAARVVTVTPPANNQPLAFVLQQTMIAAPSAVTDCGRRGVGGVAITNPYVCKVRLVE